MIGPWTHPYRMRPEERSAGKKAGDVISICLLFAVLGGALWLARWNHARGRGDRQGAFRLALFVLQIPTLAASSVNRMRSSDVRRASTA